MKHTFDWWRGEDETWKTFSEKWPGDSTEEIYIRAEVNTIREIIESSLERLNFFNGLEMDAEEFKSHSPPSSSKTLATRWIQPWSIPYLPEATSGIEKGFEFDGSCYHIQIM